METTAQSEDKAIAEELLHFFVDASEKEAFAAMLFTCYDLIQPDVALEVSPQGLDWGVHFQVKGSARRASWT